MKYKNKNITQHKSKSNGSIRKSHSFVDKLKNFSTSIKNNPSGLGLANYCGPGTKLNGQPCTSKSDCACKKHDYDYQNISNNYKTGKINKNNAIMEVRNSDNQLLNSLRNIKEKNITDKIVNNVSYAGIKLKTILEDQSLLDPTYFLAE